MKSRTQKTTSTKGGVGTPNYTTEGNVREIVDEVVRAAVREQARAVEEHLTSIHERLLALESRRPLGR